MATAALITAYALEQYQIDALKEIEGENYEYPFNDNGAETDGNAYLLNLNVEQVLALEGTGISVEALDKAVFIHDYTVQPERGLILGRWTGWQSSQVAIFENQQDVDAYYAYVANQPVEENE